MNISFPKIEQYCLKLGLTLFPVLTLLAATPLAAAGEPPRFELSFTSPPGQKVEGELALEPDLVGHSGALGVRLGPGAPAFACKAALPEQSGCLSLRFLAGRLGRANETGWTLLSLGEEGKTLRLARRAEGGFRLEGVDAQGARYQLDVEELPKNTGRDTLLEIHYTPEAIHLVADGRELAQARWAGAPAWGNTFRLGDAATPQGEAAVLALLQIGSAPAATPERTPNGKPTPWWAAGQPRLALEALAPERVPEPFEAIRWEGAEAAVWNRLYRFGGEALVEQIVSAKEPLLRGPMILRDGSGPIPFGEPKLLSHHAGKLVFQREAKRGEATLRATFTLEYDGMLWVELQGDLPAPLSLEIPFQAGAAESMQYVGAPARYESQNLARNSGSGALPAAGQTRTLPFKTYVWIGNREAGLQWFAESDEGWWPLDRKDCIRIEREPSGQARLHLALRESAPPGKASGSLRFGLVATPVKPMPVGWRGWTFTAQYGSPSGPKPRGNNVIYWPDEWRTLQLDAEPHRADPARVEATRTKVREDRAAGRRILPYWTRIHLPVFHEERMNPDAAAMLETWATEPNRPPGARLDHRRVSMATGWADYLVWCFNEWNEVFGPADGIYLDETQPIPNRRAASNGGYDAPTGERRATFEFQGSRAYMKRIHYLAQQRSGTPPRSMIHNSSTYCLPTMSEYSVFLAGEQLNSGYFQTDAPELLPPEEERAQGYYYCHVLPLDRLIAEGYGKPWGVPIAWLPQLKNQKDIMEGRVATRDLLSRLQQVDALIWPLFINQAEVNEMLAYRKAFGIEAPEVVFTPFWENGEITSDDAGVKIASYTRPGQRLLIVSNLNTHAAEPTLTLPNTGKLTDAVTGEPVETNGGKFRCSLPRNDYRAFFLTEPR